MEITEKWILPGQPIDGARLVRSAVFIEEQGFSHSEEWDEFVKISHHVEFWRGDVPVACGRVYPKEDGYRIGRIAVAKIARGTGLGARVVLSLEKKAAELGAKMVTVAAQKQAQGFYDKLGYTVLEGSDFLDGHTPHIIMYKEISEGK